MKEKNMIILIAAITLVLVASASAYVYVTSQENEADSDDVNLKLNESGKMVKINSIADYNKIIKPGKKETQSPVTATQLTERLREIFKGVFKDAIINIESSGPYKLSNGTLVHVSIVTVETSSGINTYIYLVDANHLPENKAKDKIDLTNTLEEYVCVLEKSNDKAKISQEEILNKAKQIYSSHFTPESNDKYDIDLFKVNDDNYLYQVNVNDNKEYMQFDGNTGELLVDLYEEEKTDNPIHTLEESKQKAQQTLDSKKYDYAQNLSLEYAGVEEDENSTNYTFNIVYQHDGQSEVIGSIKIDAYTLEVLSYDIKEPTIEETTDIKESSPEDYKVEEDNSYYGNGYSSSYSSSGYSDQASNDYYESYEYKNSNSSS